jgi:hypothetical protein
MTLLAASRCPDTSWRRIETATAPRLCYQVVDELVELLNDMEMDVSVLARDGRHDARIGQDAARRLMLLMG